jgi:hypothetical protein
MKKEIICNLKIDNYDYLQSKKAFQRFLEYLEFNYEDLKDRQELFLINEIQLIKCSIYLEDFLVEKIYRELKKYHIEISLYMNCMIDNFKDRDDLAMDF